LARRAAERAGEGDGVIVTHGTDCLEEVALLTDLLHSGEAPIVFTGAMRPASSSAADGPGNLRDAIYVASHPDAAGLEVMACFAGELHAATAVRKTDSVGPAAFSSPLTGPVGYVRESRVSILSAPRRQVQLDPTALDQQVEVIQAGLASSGRMLELAAAELAGVVLIIPGAGHVPPGVLASLRDAVRSVPVVVVPRPERGALLRATYGFEGAEPDVRATGAICAGALSPAGARVKLMACLGASLPRDAIAAAFAPDDI